jgi:hypothetical protein
LLEVLEVQVAAAVVLHLHPQVEQVELVEPLMAQTALLGQERLVAQEEQTLEVAVAVAQAGLLELVVRVARV